MSETSNKACSFTFISFDLRCNAPGNCLSESADVQSHYEGYLAISNQLVRQVGPVIIGCHRTLHTPPTLARVVCQRTFGPAGRTQTLVQPALLWQSWIEGQTVSTFKRPLLLTTADKRNAVLLTTKSRPSGTHCRHNELVANVASEDPYAERR
jgi:hypothetical protein